MCPIGYYMMLRNYKDPKQLRLKLVLYADEHGKKAAARRYGSEFIGSTHAKQRSVFSVTVESFKNHVHCQIPPGAHTFQADVETVHDRIEDEFYCLETFKSRSDFLAKATSYQHYFNLVRKNYSKQGKAPMQILKERNPILSPSITQLPPVFLDELVYAKSNQGGYDVGKGS